MKTMAGLAFALALAASTAAPAGGGSPCAAEPAMVLQERMTSLSVQMMIRHQHAMHAPEERR